MYRWLVLIHALSALAFMAAHGASIAATFYVKQAKTPEEMRSCLTFSQRTIGAMYWTFASVGLSGLVAGLWLDWWRTGWFWLSVAVLIGITYAMVPLAMLPFHGIRYANCLPYMGSPPGANRRRQPAETEVNLAVMNDAQAELRPWLLALIAFGGVAILVWLMMFKPF